MNLLLTMIMSLSSVKDIKVGNCYLLDNTIKIVVLATDKEGVLFRKTSNEQVYWTAFDVFINYASPTECYGK